MTEISISRVVRVEQVSLPNHGGVFMIQPLFSCRETPALVAPVDEFCVVTQLSVTRGNGRCFDYVRARDRVR